MRAAVVDGYSTGRLLVGALRDRGATCFHVRSSPEAPEWFARGFQAGDYEQDFGYVSDPALLAGELSRLGIARVVAGTESGVLLADTLTDLMGVPGNRRATLGARRDKAAMAEAARAAGLATPLGSVFSDADDAAEWFLGTGLSESVVKPLSSAGSDNVRFCRNADEVRRACEAVLRSRSLYGEANSAVLVQERLHGTEYYLNTVSQGGEHRVAEIWRYTKTVGAGGTPVYDYEEPVRSEDDEAGLLRGFTTAVLDALGVLSGAAHTEVMLTSRGPVLIECGARLGGATAPWVVEKYSGVSQTALLADSMVDPGAVARYDESSTRWSAAVRNVALINRTDGRVRSLDWVERIQSLPTVVQIFHGMEPGIPLPATADLLSSPGFVYLADVDPDAVERDYRIIRDIEGQNLYVS